MTLYTSYFHVMLLNCDAGEDSWESLGLQEDQTSQFWRELALNIHWKDWCWSWSSSTLATWGRADSLEKILMLGKIEGRRRRGWQRMRWLDSSDSMAMNLSKLQGTVEDRGTWCAAVHGVAKSWTRLSDWSTTNFHVNLEMDCNQSQHCQPLTVRGETWA